MLVDAGSFSPTSGLLLGERSAFVLRTLEEMGYDAVALAPRDAAALADSADRPALRPFACEGAAPHSVGDAGRSLVLREVGGVRVGIFSTCDTTSANASARAASAPADSADRSRFALARRAVEDLRAMGAQVVVALTRGTHARVDSLAARVPGLDVVVMAGGRPAHFEGHLTSGPSTYAPRDSLLAHARAGARAPERPLRIDPGGQGRSVDIAYLLVDREGHIVAHELERVLLNRHIALEPSVHEGVVRVLARLRRAVEASRTRD